MFECYPGVLPVGPHHSGWNLYGKDIDKHRRATGPRICHGAVDESCPSAPRTATFMKSSTALDQCPPAVLPEFAVIGRSNVGKSSLINLLTGQKSLALVSKTPGRLTDVPDASVCTSASVRCVAA